MRNEAPGKPCHQVVSNRGTMFAPGNRIRVAAAGDDPCDEAGFDELCRDRNRVLCRFHAEHCHAPDYPCRDLLRHHLAVVFLEDVALRRRGRRPAERG